MTRIVIPKKISLNSCDEVNAAVRKELLERGAKVDPETGHLVHSDKEHCVLRLTQEKILGHPDGTSNGAEFVLVAIISFPDGSCRNLRFSGGDKEDELANIILVINSEFLDGVRMDRIKYHGKSGGGKSH